MEPRTFRFGVYEADAQTLALRKHGRKLRLSGQPFQILLMLLRANGDLVTREDVRQALWPDGTFVDFDHSLNSAVNKLRDTLSDSATSPRYIETVPRKGYRFLGPVRCESDRTHETGRPAMMPRLASYTAIALLAAVATLLIVHSQYDKFAPSRRAPLW